MWQPKTQGEILCTALLSHDGRAVQTEQAVVVSQTAWLDPQGGSNQADPRTALAEYSECVYCLRSLPHAERQHNAISTALIIKTDHFSPRACSPLACGF